MVSSSATTRRNDLAALELFDPHLNRLSPIPPVAAERHRRDPTAPRLLVNPGNRNAEALSRLVQSIDGLAPPFVHRHRSLQHGLAARERDPRSPKREFCAPWGALVASSSISGLCGLLRRYGDHRHDARRQASRSRLASGREGVEREDRRRAVLPTGRPAFGLARRCES
jgi:hypothetical protein